MYVYTLCVCFSNFIRNINGILQSNVTFIYVLLGENFRFLPYQTFRSKKKLQSQSTDLMADKWFFDSIVLSTKMWEVGMCKRSFVIIYWCLRKFNDKILLKPSIVD